MCFCSCLLWHQLSSPCDLDPVFLVQALEDAEFFEILKTCFFSIWLRNQHWRSSDLDPVSPDELFRVMVLCKHILLLRDVIRCWVSLVLKSAIKNKAYYTGIRPWWPFPRSNNRRKLNTSINLAFWMILTLCVIPKFIIHSKNLTGPGHIIWNLWKGAKKCYM